MHICGPEYFYVFAVLSDNDLFNDRIYVIISVV